jgi:hypothetical protein
MGFTSFRGLGLYLALGCCPVPLGTFWDFLASAKQFFLPFVGVFLSPILFPVFVLNAACQPLFRYLIIERVKDGHLLSLTLASWLDGIPVMVTSYHLYAPLHTFDGESPGGGVADYL